MDRCLMPCLRCRTKIVCTLGPACEERTIIRDMIEAGMAVARINFSHGTYEEHGRRISLCRAIAQELGVTIGILADLQGPKFRIGSFAEGRVNLRIGQDFTLTLESIPGNKTRVHVPHPEVLAAVSRGSHILLGDGDIELVATDTHETEVHCQVVVGGVLASHKGITVPGVHVHVPAITNKDRADLAFALEQSVDFVAMSFVQEAKDVDSLRHLIQERGEDTPIIAKIERSHALDEFDDILASADGIMVARGDLGLEVPAEEVPIHQKMLISKSRAAGKPVITATQMLESMMANPRPTRAEASDVANAILDGSDAVMLSGETAAGKYPVAAVRMMQRIAQVTEEHLPYREWAHQMYVLASGSVTEAITQATSEISTDLGARAIIAATMSGWTARMVAKTRPRAPIIAVTPSQEVLGRLSLVWGVAPLLVPHYDSTDAMTVGGVAAARQRGLVQDEDLVVLTAGVPLGGPGRTNMIRVHRVGEVTQLASTEASI